MALEQATGCCGIALAFGVGVRHHLFRFMLGTFGTEKALCIGGLSQVQLAVFEDALPEDNKSRSSFCLRTVLPSFPDRPSLSFPDRVHRCTPFSSRNFSTVPSHLNVNAENTTH